MQQLELTFGHTFIYDRQPERGGEIAVRFVKNRRSKRYIVRVLDESSVRVTIPRGGSRRMAMAFFEEQQDWVCSRLEEFRGQNSRRRIPWTMESRIWFRGRLESVKGVLEQAGLEGASGLDPALWNQPIADLKEVTEAQMRNLARIELPARVIALAQGVGVRPVRISIRGQKTRWGSCSARGNLSLNWRLVQVPLSVRDYVLIHELCHLQHMNHSPSFWSLVRQHCPSYKRSEAWLKAHADIITDASA